MPWRIRHERMVSNQAGYGKCRRSAFRSNRVIVSDSFSCIPDFPTPLHFSIIIEPGPGAILEDRNLTC